MGKKVDTYPIKYILYDNTKKITKIPDKDKTKLEEYTESLRDLKTSWLSKLGGKKENKKFSIEDFIFVLRLSRDSKFFVRRTRKRISGTHVGLYVVSTKFGPNGTKTAIASL